ncbi:hypothetical protein C6P45_002273 [Maudiozyma exigua]|uniref:Glucosidase II subunit alpha n=1 Tax=Maudiozyma exigua TaxID=34358 RepID=A0A9P7B4T1_MAUEX|nr:hypothetical protein C6P45_002273 [Kazachstania exigua]
MNLTLLRFLLTLTFLIQNTLGFTDYLLKKCNQSGFCQRNRFYATNIQQTHNNYYHIEHDSIRIDTTNNELLGNIIKTVPRDDIQDIEIILPFKLSFQNDWESIRFIIDEKIRPDINNNFLKNYRYIETSKWAFANGTTLNNLPLNVKIVDTIIEQSFFEAGSQLFNKFVDYVFQASDITNDQGSNKSIKITNDFNNVSIILSLDSFQINVYKSDILLVSINDRALFNFEQHRSIEDNFQNVLPEESTYNMFADDFEYSNTDHIPFGPESVALDFTLHKFNSLYGIPEHADSLRLKDTTDEEPYRLFNVDVFQYNLNSRMPMYGAIPLLLSTNGQNSIGIFWNNPADTWVDIHYPNDETSQSHFMSETGIIDVFIFISDRPNQITNSFTQLTGRPALPLLSSIGYHQCRWNYNDELDVLNVQENMDKQDIPFDFIWLDLEYTDEKKYFTWKPDSFGNPTRMLQKLNKYGRQLAILIDPHLKTNYHISDEVEKNEAATLNDKGNTYIGRCWPGDSIWIDTMGEIGRKLWSAFFKDFITIQMPKYIDNLHIWNDMNEPSIFNGPETTAPKDLIHKDGFEERAIHNIYGLTVHETTYDAMKNIYGTSDKRPFILTRSFYAGSQRTAATWTGDNIANWDYLKASIPMVLSNNIVGMPFIGADIAGFDGNPSAELLTRWYQAGLWYPFFRAHAHIDTIRREPYLLDTDTRNIVRDSIRLRYQLLPTLYSAFHTASVNGNAIMKPMFFKYPEIKEFYDIDDQFYLGDYGILVKPVTSPETFTTEIRFPQGIFYDLDTLHATIIDSEIKDVMVNAPIDKIPAFIEGGHVLFKREIYRRSSKLMVNDPYTLLIAPDILSGSATGKLYVDDGETFSYESGEYLDTVVTLVNNSMLKNVVDHQPQNSESLGNTLIDKIVIAVDKNNVNINEITVKVCSETKQVNFEHQEGETSVTIRGLGLHLDEDWEILF